MIPKAYHSDYTNSNLLFEKNILKFPFKEYSTKKNILNNNISLAEKFKLQSARRNKNMNSLVKVSNKTFLSKLYKGYFQGLVFQKQNKEEEYVEITDTIIFENKKLTIIDMDMNSPDKISQYMLLAIYPIIAFSGYKLIFAIKSFSFFRSIMWSVILFYSLKFRFGLKANQEHIINEINLLQDGKTCEIKTLKGKFNMDINKIRKINFEEAMFMANKLDSIKRNFIPIIMDTKLYLIPLSCRIHRKDFLGYISEGKYFKFEEIIQKDKTIQI